MKTKFKDADYIKKRKQSIKRRARGEGHEDETTFDGMLSLALQGKTKPLREYMHANRLSAQQQNTIAHHFGVAYQHGKPGAPKGHKKAAGDLYDRLRSAGRHILDKRKEWATKNDRKRVPPVVTNKALANAMTMFSIPRTHEFEMHLRGYLKAPKRANTGRTAK